MKPKRKTMRILCLKRIGIVCIGAIVLFILVVFRSEIFRQVSLMHLWIFSGAVFFVCAAAIFWLYRHDGNARLQALISLAVTATGTLAGVLLALDLGNRSTVQTEKETYAALVGSSLSEIAAKTAYADSSGKCNR